MKILKKTGLQRRWLLNSASIMVVLVVLVVIVFSAFIGVYYYSNVSSGLEAKAKTTTDFFGNYISQNYNDYFQSCVRFAQSFEESGVLELQFITASGKLVASSYGPWTGQIEKTTDIQQALETKEISVYQGVNPGTGEGDIKGTYSGTSMSLDFTEYWHSPHKTVHYTGSKL